ncbi:hypothetical protein NNA33_18955, partial [Marisediminitalea aggregata]|nr:hypothetical protein [Marisediminitalea aggregata]
EIHERLVGSEMCIRDRVSTSGEKVIVIYGDQRIEVLSNGSYDITQISSDMRSDEALNVDLLSRAIKHLTRFKL